MQAFTDPSASDTAGGCRVGPKPLPSAESTGAKGQRQSVGDHPIGRSHLDQEPSSPDSKISGVLGRDRGEATDGAVDQATEIQLDDTRSEGLEDGAGTETECDDPDSAYVNAMEEIWAEAEAWVDAEAQVRFQLNRERGGMNPSHSSLYCGATGWLRWACESLSGSLFAEDTSAKQRAF